VVLGSDIYPTTILQIATQITVLVDCVSSGRKVIVSNCSSARTMLTPALRNRRVQLLHTGQPAIFTVPTSRVTCRITLSRPQQRLQSRYCSPRSHAMRIGDGAYDG
jgi:hypothetical protein